MRRIFAVAAAAVLLAAGAWTAGNALAEPASTSIDGLKATSESGWLTLLSAGCTDLTLAGSTPVAQLCGGTVAKGSGLPDKDIENLSELSDGGWRTMLDKGVCTLVKSSGGDVVGTVCPIVDGVALPTPATSSPDTVPQDRTRPSSSSPKPSSSSPKPPATKTSPKPSSSSPKPSSSSPKPSSSSPKPTGSSSAPSGPAPSSLLNLSNWYLGIPVNTSHDGAPDIIRQPELNGYVSPAWFHADAARNGVVFDVNAGGYTTSGSDYPRTELREMNGTKNASWDSRSGTHTMQVTEAITKVTPKKPSMVSAQIHDADDDVVQIRLDGKVLSAQSDDGGTKTTLNANYVLGTVFTVKLVAISTGVDVYYNGKYTTTIKAAGAGYYFKAGAYLQSNVSKGEAPGAIGEVIIYGLTVQHTA